MNDETSKNNKSIEHDYTNEIDSYKDEDIDTNASPQVEVKYEVHEEAFFLYRRIFM